MGDMGDPVAVTCHVLDFETTGPDPLVDLPVSVAVVALAPNEPPRVVLSQRCDPGIPITEGAAAIHGITSTEGEEPWADVAPRVWALMSSARYAAAYNAPFDGNILRRSVEYRRLQWLDPLVWARDFWWGSQDGCPAGPDGKRSLRLEHVARFYGIDLDAHNAEADAMATAQVMRKMTPAAMARSKSNGWLAQWTRQQGEAQERWLRKKFGGPELWSLLG